MLVALRSSKANGCNSPRSANASERALQPLYFFSLVRIHKGRLVSGIGKAGPDGLRCERPTFRVLVAEAGRGIAVRAVQVGPDLPIFDALTSGAAKLV